MPVLSYTCETLQLLFEELGLALSKPISRLLAWLMIALLEKTRAHLFRLAEKLPDDETTDMARRQRVLTPIICPRAAAKTLQYSKNCASGLHRRRP